MAIPLTFGSKRDAATFDAALVQIADTYDLLTARCNALKNGYATATAADFESVTMGGVVGTGAERVAARDALALYVGAVATGASVGQDVTYHLNMVRSVGR